MIMTRIVAFVVSRWDLSLGIPCVTASLHVQSNQDH